MVAIAQAADADYLARKPARLSAFMLAHARTAFLVEVDPADANRRLLLQMKNELAADPGTLAFGITPHETAPGQSAGTATFEPHRPGMSPHEFTIRQSRSFNSAKAEAIEFLRDLFGNEKRLQVRHIEAQARAFGLLKPDQPISQCRPLRDARIALGLQVVRAGFAKDGVWSWAKPGAREEEEQAEVRATQEEARQRAEMQQEPIADQPPVPEQQITPKQGAASADQATPIGEASPPLQPAPARTGAPADVGWGHDRK